MPTLTKIKNEVRNTQTRNQELEVINESDVPGLTRNSRYDPYIEKFKQISKGQGVVLEEWSASSISGIRQTLKSRNVGDFSIRTRKDKAYLIKK